MLLLLFNYFVQFKSLCQVAGPQTHGPYDAGRRSTLNLFCLSELHLPNCKMRGTPPRWCRTSRCCALILSPWSAIITCSRLQVTRCEARRQGGAGHQDDARSFSVPGQPLQLAHVCRSQDVRHAAKVVQDIKMMRAHSQSLVSHYSLLSSAGRKM